MRLLGPALLCDVPRQRDDTLHLAILVICISTWLLCAVLFGVTAVFIPRDVARLRRTMETRAEAEQGRV